MRDRMRFISLELHNIRSYTDESITFPDGTLLLSGDIGAGKTTLLLAIEFALFGSKRGTLGSSALLRNGSNEGHVTLTFSAGGKHAVVHRVLKRTKDSIKQDAGYIEVNGVREDATAQEIKSRVFSILGYPQNLVGKGDDLVYRFTVFTPQEAMKDILLCDPQKRLDILRRVFGIDKYKQIRENISLYTKELRSRVRELKGVVSDFDEKKKLFTEKNRRIIELDTELKKISEEKDILLARYVEKKEALGKIDSEKQKLNEVLTQISVKESACKEKEVHCTHIDQSIIGAKENLNAIKHKYDALIVPSDVPLVENLQKEIDNFESQIKDVRENAQTMRERKSALLTERNHIEKELPRAEEDEKQFLITAEKVRKIGENLAKRERILERKALAQENRRVAHEKKVSSEVVMSQSQETISNISDIASCPLCQQDVPHEHKNSILEREKKKEQDHKSVVTTSQEAIVAAEKEIAEMDSKITILQDQEKKREGFTAWITEYEVRKKKYLEMKKRQGIIAQELASIITREETINLEELEERLSEKKKYLTNVQEMTAKVKEKEHLLNSLTEKQKHIEELNGQKNQQLEAVKSIKLEIEQLLTQKEAFKDLEERHTTAKNVFEEAQSLQHKNEVAKAALDSEYSTLRKSLRELQDELDTKKEAHQKMSHSTSLVNWYDEMFVNLCGTLEKHVMGKINREFNELFKDWFATLVGDEQISVMVDDEFTPLIIQNGYEQQIDNLSGGEKTAVALAYRLALNKVINDLIKNIATNDVIVLDEPTDGFSSSQLDKVRDVLEQLNTKQTIIVSHDAKIESFVESITRIAKSDHVSRIL